MEYSKIRNKMISPILLKYPAHVLYPPCPLHPLPVPSNSPPFLPCPSPAPAPVPGRAVLPLTSSAPSCHSIPSPISTPTSPGSSPPLFWPTSLQPSPRARSSSSSEVCRPLSLSVPRTNPVFHPRTTPRRPDTPAVLAHPRCLPAPHCHPCPAVPRHPPPSPPTRLRSCYSHPPPLLSARHPGLGCSSPRLPLRTR
ncbi:hypothetical protein BDQ17DRAFT_997533 [Cyathus striatus]|nr:hypothetical protein BDQ17DRAFT_997533 [Cyathus striatus]